METEIHDKIVMSDNDVLIDCLALSSAACFYDVMKKLEVDINKIHSINRKDLTAALKAEILHRIVR